MKHQRNALLNPEKSIGRNPSRHGLNLIGRRWMAGLGATTRCIHNPADTRQLVAEVREASPEQVDEACQLAAQALPTWRAVPAPNRARVLFRYRQLLEEHFDELAALVVQENGKLLSEARGSLRRRWV